MPLLHTGLGLHNINESLIKPDICVVDLFLYMIIFVSVHINKGMGDTVVP